MGGKRGGKNKRESVDTYTNRQFTLVAWIFGFASMCMTGIMGLALRMYCVVDEPRRKKYENDKAEGCCKGD